MSAGGVCRFWALPSGPEGLRKDRFAWRDPFCGNRPMLGLATE